MYLYVLYMYYIVGAVRALSYAVDGHTNNSLNLIKLNGLKLLGPVLLGRGLPKSSLLGTTQLRKEVKEAQEQCISIFSQLCIHIHSPTPSPSLSQAVTNIDSESENKGQNYDESLSEYKEYSLRLLLKLTENNNEKLLYCITLFYEYWSRLERTQADIASTLSDLSRVGDVEGLRAYGEEEHVREMVRALMMCMMCMILYIR